MTKTIKGTDGYKYTIIADSNGWKVIDPSYASIGNTERNPEGVNFYNAVKAASKYYKTDFNIKFNGENFDINFL